MNKIHYFLLAVYLIFSLSLTNGCGDDVVVTDPNGPLHQCIGYITHYAAVEYDYMGQLSLIENGISKLSYAFSRAGTTISFEPAFGTTNDKYICLIGSPGTPEQINLYMLDYLDSFYNYKDTSAIFGNCLGNSYLVGIDSFNYNQQQYFGIASLTNPLYSSVFAGKIIADPDYGDSSKRAIEIICTHELGHIFGLDHLFHTGRFQAICIMRGGWVPGNEGFYRNIFCDTQTCFIYDKCDQLSGGAIRQFKFQSNKHLSVTINTEKETYLKGEPIWVEIKIKNTGSNIETINYNLEDKPIIANFIQLYDNEGKHYEYKGITGFSNNQPTTLYPNEERNYYIQILESFGIKNENSIPYSCPFYLPENSYYLKSQIIFDSLYSMQSNQINLKVVEPIEIETEAYNKMKILFSKDGEKIPNYLNKSIEAKNFLLLFPTSVYYNMVFYYYMTFRLNKEIDLDSYPEDCLEFTDRFPNSPYLMEIIGSAVSALERTHKKKDIEIFLTGIKDKYPNTYSSSVANDLLNNAVIQKLIK